MSESTVHPVGEGAPDIRDLTLADIATALRLGLKDFLRKPMMGLFFATVYVVGGWLLYLFLFVTDQIWLALPITVGFPLLGPFLAVGLYEISRRLEAGQTSWARNEILGVIWHQRLRQLPSMAWVIIVYFLFWSFFAHMLFALFLGPSALTNVTTSYAYLLQPEGVLMLLVGTAFGAVFAFVLFTLSVVSLPLLLDREIDFVTAMITSVSVVKQNTGVMLVWGVVIAGLTFVGMIPGLLGLFVVLPLLGHATWHIYRLVTVTGPGA
ncbi:DUF2189 domain-containing protein [Rhodobacteraceae bacterium N5(2021)]|uniref:DUF2189 domain-containing protein n=1 Tax=Gymnodinialimonas phycosphaerae TaxID=2841589 RepID=A0A975TYN5_9RHOB|nr:DUF2189 domain-containing protein [Gymnodinialimonas phycosphaerae]MBY4892396.1 DUF2189 domain-containing protein [Gymnodinialimonas phycosphaerae]